MPLVKSEDLEKIIMKAETAKNVSKQVAISPVEGWDGWVMRIITIGSEGYSPRHTHPWPHINYIIKGTGELLIDGEKKAVKTGDTAYIPEGEDHQFINTGNDDFSFICIVPEEGDK